MTDKQLERLVKKDGLGEVRTAVGDLIVGVRRKEIGDDGIRDRWSLSTVSSDPKKVVSVQDLTTAQVLDVLTMIGAQAMTGTYTPPGKKK